MRSSTKERASPCAMRDATEERGCSSSWKGREWRCMVASLFFCAGRSLTSSSSFSMSPKTIISTKGGQGHPVVGKAEGVEGVVVVYAQHGEEPRHTEGAGTGRTQYGIVVVQGCVDAAGVRVTQEAFAHKHGPVKACGLSFFIVAVA